MAENKILTVDVDEVVNHFTASTGRVGTMIFFTVDGEQQGAWNNDPNHQIVDDKLKVQLQEDGYYKVKGNFLSKKAEITFRETARAKAFGSYQEA